MDVRCEKCGTEYELDDSRLRPAGVSVKCTSCGHVFRVRRHPVTSVGVGSAEALPPAPRRPDTERDLELPPMLDEDEPGDQISSDTIPMPTLTPGAPPGPRMGRMTPSNARALARRTKERNWLVRLPSGEIETCRELATLHQWIIAGKVTRNSGISRTGKSWKRLGEIRELEPFFDVAEETRRARMSGTPGTPADAPGARSVARPEARSAAKPGGRADAQGRQMPRVIQPIPDSFSASGPVDAGDDAGPDAGDDAGDDAWGESRTAESMPPETGAGAPEPPVLPAGAGRPVGAALAAGGDGKRTLLGVPSGSPVPLYGRSYADDADDGPTEEVDPALALAGHRGALAGLADDEPGAPDDDLDDGPDDARDDDRDDVRDEDLDDDDDEPAPARLEDMSNPLDRRLPRPAELAPAEPGPRPPAGEAAAASGRSGGPGGLASTLRGPAPVPMAPAGRAVGPDRAEDGAQAASALQGAAGAAGAFGAGPAGRVHAAAQAQDPAARRSPAAGQGAPGASPNAFNGASGAGGDDASDDASASISNAFGDPFTGDSGAGFGAGSGAGSGAGFEGPRRLDRAGLAHVAAMDGPIGPTAGLARRSAVQDVAFAKGKIRPLPDDAGNEIAEVRPAGGSSRAGRWIVAVALVLMAASAAVVYTLVFRPAGDAIDGLALDADAGSGEPGAPDGGADSAATEELAELVRTRLAMDTQAGLEALDRQLKDVGGDAMLAARARVHTAQAQHLFDGVALAGSDAARAAELDREAKALVLEALTLAQRALQADREAPDALVAMADVQRLQGRQARQVESYLETALKREPEHREARLVRALMLAASERTRKDARALLESLSRSAQGLDVRPGYRLALLDLAEAKPEDARRRASEVLAVDPAHEGARALLAHLDASPVVDTSDPMPVEETPSPAPEGNGKDTDRDTGDHARDEGSSGGSYDDLVARADKKAQAKDCREAIELYERALDDNPSGVSALMGMAECHVERKEFASAYAKLQAVLAVSPSHAEALWRMAEAYRKQGLSAQAESWYRKYVEEHPSGPRASKARQRIDELGNAAPAPGGGSGSGAGGSGTEPAGGGSTEPPAGQGDPPPASAPGSGDAPGATAG